MTTHPRSNAQPANDVVHAASPTAGDTTKREEAVPSGARKVLMLAYVFPPFGSVGWSIRVVKFARYLPALGWLPAVLTIDDTREYGTQRRKGSSELLKDIPDGVQIYRTGAGEPSMAVLEKGREARRKSRVAAVVVNALRAVRNFAQTYLLLPDEHITWLPAALKMGRRIVRDEDIDVIFTTCPPHSSAITGACLKLVTGKPLILDFRDDWIDTPWYRSRPRVIQWLERRLERWAVKVADRVTVVTDWSRAAFRARYPEEPADKFVLIPNGYDRADFTHLEQVTSEQIASEQADVRSTLPRVGSRRAEQFLIVHAGSLSESEAWKRSPEGFFEALTRLRDDHPDLGQKLVVAFTGHLPEAYRQMVTARGLTDIVRELGHLPRPAFAALLRTADLLLAINFDGAATLIPGKIYEYWMSGRAPILLLSCPGAAQGLLNRHGLGMTVQPYDAASIANAILEVYRRREAGEPLHLSTAGIEAYDRQVLTERLAEMLTGMNGTSVTDAGPVAEVTSATGRMRAEHGHRGHRRKEAG